MAEKVMTLYFEDTGIKWLVAKGKKAEQWENIPLEPGLVAGGIIVNEPKVAEKVKEIVATIKSSRTKDLIFGKGKIVVGLGGRDSLYRVISLPVLEQAILGEAVRREAGRVLPVPLDQLYLAYQRIPGNSNETRVFLAAFPKTATDALIRTLHLAGVTPRMLDLAPLALCLSVNEPMAIIADASLDNLNIMIITERVPQVIRSLHLQSEGKSVLENIATISEEFSRTVAFYNSSHQQSPISADVPVFVSGDLAKAPETWPALVGKLNSKVAALPSVIQYPDNFPASDFTVNLGLATKGLSLEKEPGNYSLVNLNALPDSARQKPINLYRILIPVVAVIGVVGVFIMWNGWQTSKKNAEFTQTQVTAIQNLITAQVKDASAITQQNKTVQAQIQPMLDTANIFTNKLIALSAARSLTDNQINQILALKPKTVNISGLTYSNSGAKNSASTNTINGFTGTQADVLNYAQVLRDQGGFTVVVSSLTYNPVTSDTGEIIPSYDYMLNIK
jgi:type IV pilus assembly protein PilM